MAGTVRDAAADLTGDMPEQVKGKAEKMEGKIQETVGRVQEKIGRKEDEERMKRRDGTR